MRLFVFIWGYAVLPAVAAINLHLHNYSLALMMSLSSVSFAIFNMEVGKSHE